MQFNHNFHTSSPNLFGTSQIIGNQEQNSSPPLRFFKNDIFQNKYPRLSSSQSFVQSTSLSGLRPGLQLNSTASIVASTFSRQPIQSTYFSKARSNTSNALDINEMIKHKRKRDEEANTEQQDLKSSHIENQSISEAQQDDDFFDVFSKLDPLQCADDDGILVDNTSPNISPIPTPSLALSPVQSPAAIFDSNFNIQQNTEQNLGLLSSQLQNRQFSPIQATSPHNSQTLEQNEEQQTSIADSQQFDSGEDTFFTTMSASQSHSALGSTSPSIPSSSSFIAKQTILSLQQHQTINSIQSSHKHHRHKKGKEQVQKMKRQTNVEWADGLTGLDPKCEKFDFDGFTNNCKKSLQRHLIELNDPTSNQISLNINNNFPTTDMIMDKQPQNIEQSDTKIFNDQIGELIQKRMLLVHGTEPGPHFPNLNQPIIHGRGQIIDNKKEINSEKDKIGLIDNMAFFDGEYDYINSSIQQRRINNTRKINAQLHQMPSALIQQQDIEDEIDNEHINQQAQLPSNNQSSYMKPTQVTNVIQPTNYITILSQSQSFSYPNGERTVSPTLRTYSLNTHLSQPKQQQQQLSQQNQLRIQSPLNEDNKFISQTHRNLSPTSISSFISSQHPTFFHIPQYSSSSFLSPQPSSYQSTSSSYPQFQQRQSTSFIQPNPLLSNNSLHTNIQSRNDENSTQFRSELKNRGRLIGRTPEIIARLTQLKAEFGSRANSGNV